VKQVFSKFAIRNALLKVLMGSSNNAYVYTY